MSRRYHETIEVQLGDPAEHQVRLEPGWQRSAQPMVGQVPTLFLWRGRVHVVRGVLAQWTQRTPWWRRTGEDRAGQTGALEQQVWRVQAGAGRSHGLGVYDLVQAEQWRLERVSD